MRNFIQNLKQVLIQSGHSLDPILSRFCLVSLILLTIGVGQTWGSKKTQGTITIKSGKGSVTITAYYKTNAWTTKSKSGSISTKGDNEASNIGQPYTFNYDRGNTEDGWVTFSASAGTGYTFAGWYEDSSCSGTPATGDYTVDENACGKAWYNLHPDVTKTLYTKFTPNSYTIVYNGNGKTHGSTANTNAKYDANVTFATNGFYKSKYVVTYDINGGTCGTAVDTAYYPFEGWSTSAGGSVAYTNGQTTTTAPNLATSGNTYLYAKWGTGTTSVTLPTPTAVPSYDGDGSYSFAGWYDGDTKVGVGGGTYIPTKNVTLKAKWTLTKEPGFSGANQALNVGGTYSGFVFSNTSTTTPSSSSNANFYYVIETTTAPTGNRDGSEHPNDVISFDGTTVTALNNGVATIKFYQKADAGNNIAAGESATFTFTVSRNVPTFTWNTREHYYYNETISNFFASNQSQTVLTRGTNNSSVASLEGNVLVVCNKAGTARITVSQAENYYWAAIEEYKDITPEKTNNHVAFTITNSNHTTFETSTKSSNASWSNPGFRLCDGGWSTRDDYMVIRFTGIPDKLNFDKSLETSLGQLPGTYKCQVYQSADGTNWGTSPVWEHNERVENKNGNVVQLDPTTRYIKFAYHGTVYCNYKNINVTELQYFKTATANLDFATNQLNHVPATQSFVVEHANAGYQTSVTAPDHYLVSLNNVDFASEVVYSTNATALTGGDKYGTFTVYVKYLADAEGTHAANVIVSNNLRADISLPVTGTTQGKLATHINYIGASAYSVNADNVAATTLFEVRDANNNLVANPVITLGKNETSTVDIVNGNAEVDFKCGGSVTITASYAGDEDTYAAASNLAQVITINRLDDEVSFEHGKAVLVAGDEFDLEGWASALSGTEITYTTASTSVIRVEDGKVKAIGKGSATLTATSAGDCTYNSGIAKLTIKVRNASDPCETALLYKSSKHNINLYSGTQTYTIKEGPQDKLTFKVWKTSAVATYSADVKILDNSDNVLHTYTYSVGDLSTTEPETPNVEIDITQYPTARKISVSGSGTLYKYISELRVSQKAYLTASTSSVTMSAVKACETATGQFNISYSDLSTLHLTQTNENFSYEVWNGETKLEGFANDCGDYGMYTVKFFYTPQVVGPYSNEVTISASGKSQVITLSGTANKPDRTIVWDIPTGNTITATQSVNLTAYAKTDCEDPAGSVTYSYTSAVAGAATIEGSKITFNKAATVTVKAETVTSDMYEDATYVEKVWTVGKVGTQMRTLPTITSTITYGDNSSVVTYDNDSWKAEEVLNNTEVKGHINYVGPASFTAAGPQNLIFNFTPDSIATYDVCQFTVPVTVNKLATLNVPVALSFCAGESETFHGETFDTAGEYDVPAEGATRDTVYKVTVTVLQPTTGTDSKTITYGDNESWNGIDLSDYAAGSYSVVAVLTNAVGCDSTVTLTLTVNAPINEFTNAAGDGDWSNEDNWTSVPTSENPDVIVSGQLIIDNDVTVGGLTIKPEGGVTVITNGTLTVNGSSADQSGYGDLYVRNGGEVEVAGNLRVGDLVVEASIGTSIGNAKSGQVANAENIVYTNAYIDINMDPSGVMDDTKWYGFTVPFAVNAHNGVSRLEGTTFRQCGYGTDYVIAEYDADKRLNSGNGWKYISGNTLNAGQFYFFGVDGSYNTYRFKASGSAYTPAADASLSVNGDVTNYDANWNGVGNSTLQHVTASYAGGEYVQVYMNGQDAYKTVSTDEATFVVGCPFFIQAKEATTLSLSEQNSSTEKYYAPRRMQAEATAASRISLSATDGGYSDQIYFSAVDKEQDAYIIGQDLAKAGVSTMVPQLWMAQYNQKLSVHEAAWNGDYAICPLGIYAPQAGTYELTIERAQEDADLYLTYNDAIIWDLTASPYILDLTKGTTNGYGLRMEARRGPQVTTDIDTVNGEKGARKVLIDNVLYIVTPEGRMYDIVGKGIKY